MILRLLKRSNRRIAPQPRGQRIFTANDGVLAKARCLFSRFPFDEELPLDARSVASLTLANLNPAVTTFLDSLGRLPQRSYLAPELLAAWDCGDYIQEHVSFHITDGQAAPAYLLRPKNAFKPLPALIAIHGHGGNFIWGKSKVTNTWLRSPTYGYGIRLARQGYVVLAPDLIAFEERSFANVVTPGPWGRDAERLVFGNLLLKGATLAGWNLFELSRAVDYLQTRDDVDPSHIGVIGHSMGGSLAPFLMLFDHRVQVGVVSCGISTWRAMMARHVIHNFSCYIPGLVESADLDVLLGAIAPRPFMILAGEQDQNFPLEGVRAVGRAIEQLYLAAGSPQAAEVHINPGGHLFSHALQDKAISFLQRWLPVHSLEVGTQP